MQPIFMVGPDGAELFTATCYACLENFISSADRVTTILVDPVTQIPPDVEFDEYGNAQRTRLPASKEELERCVPRYVCPSCAKMADILRDAYDNCN